MTTATDRDPLSPVEYLRWEAEQNRRYEYIEGDLYAMTGGTLPHNSITLNLAAALKTHLRGKNCKVFMSDAKLQVNDKVYLYPDVVVTCDSRDRAAQKYIQHPKLIIEVLSPGTEAKDRGRKFYHYRRLPSLQEYCWVTPDTMRIECYRLNAQQKWELTTYSSDEDQEIAEELILPLVSVGLEYPFSLIYEDVIFPESDMGVG